VSLKSRSVLLGFVFSIWLATTLLVTPAFALDSDASSKDGAACPAQLSDVFAKLETLVKEYYPKAKITKSDKAFHFETKVKSEEGYYSHKLEKAPESGGIRGDVSLESGEYAGTYKDRLACELNEGFFRLLVLAPHCQTPNCHLLAILAFPSDVPVEFKTDFKRTISAFGTSNISSENSAEKPPMQPSISDSKANQEHSKVIPETSAAQPPTSRSSITAPVPSAERAETKTVDQPTADNPLIKNARQLFDRFKALDLASNPRIIDLYSNDAKIYMGMVGADGRLVWRNLTKENYGTFTASAYAVAPGLNAQTRYLDPKFVVDKHGAVMVSFTTQMPGAASNVQWLLRPNKAKVWQIVDERSVSRKTK